MILVNGQQQGHISVLDRGLQYGDGVFETCAIRNGIVLAQSQHIERLRTSCLHLGIAPPSIAVLEKEIETLCKEESRSVLKIIVTRSVGGRGYRPVSDVNSTRILSLHKWPDYPEKNHYEGIVAGICNEVRLGHNPTLAGLKHLNRLEQVMASRELDTQATSELIVLDLNDNIVEGTMSNIFLVIGGKLITPELHLAGVKGLVRSNVLSLCKSMKLDVEIRTIAIEELSRASEVFFCNSIIGIWPVSRIKDKEFSIGDIPRQLTEQLSSQNLIMS